MLNVIFPKLCNGCKNKLLRAEKILCTNCRHLLPLACHHRTNDVGMSSVFYGRVAVANATAMLYFNKRGIVQELLHNLKYRGQEEIGLFFGKWLGEELSEIKAYQEIDYVVPVPIHKTKKRKRGYNQSTGFGNEIAKALQKPMMEDVLYKKLKTKSQVFKQRFSRFEGEEAFAIQNSEKIKGRHVLIVDDVLTTGATLETCATLLLDTGASKISVATIAIA